MSCNQSEHVHLTHDLRVQMQLVSGALQMIWELAGDEPIMAGKEDVTTFLTLIEEGTQRMMHMFNQALGDVSNACAPVSVNNLSDIAQQVSQSMTLIASMHGFRLSYQAYAAPLLRCSRDKMERVLFNLLTNSIKYTPSQSDIRLIVTQEKDQAMVIVEDAGEGLSAHHKYLLTTPNTHAGVSALGSFGLRSVRQLVDEMQGSISVENLEGTGNRIILRFPMCEIQRVAEE